jgi:hypothetical protein
MCTTFNANSHPYFSIIFIKYNGALFFVYFSSLLLYLSISLFLKE